jgi:hypothetical protein
MLMSKKFCIAVVAASVIMMATPAAALSFEDIAGKWCSDFGSEEFSPNTLAVIRKSDGSRSDYPIARYSYQDTRVTVYWKNAKGDEVSTSFGDFTSDGRMTQLKTDSAGTIPHHRC